MAAIVVLLGAPGAGKGTQAKRLCEALSVPHVSTGDLFRANLAQGTELGQRAKGFMEAGELVPDELVLDMLLDRVAAEDCRAGYLLDGFPRTLPQAEAYGRRLNATDTLRVLEIEVPEEELVSRLTGRLVCGSCGATYHQRFAPPAQAGICDACGGALEQRKDDSEEVVRKRLSVYREETRPLVEYYRSQGLLASVSGVGTPDQVFAGLMGQLGREVA